MRRPRYVFSAAVLAALLCVVSSYAQVTTANIVGTVTDTSGAVVPGAKVTITNLGTQQIRSMETGGGGDYAFNLVEPGRYSLRVEVQGFKAFESKNVVVGAGDRLRVDAAMEVGKGSETIDVVGESAPALQTESSTVQDVVNQAAVQSLPLNGRNLIGLVQITAGVNPGPANAMSSGNRDVDRRPSYAFSANGQSDLLNNNMVDGLDNNERSQGFSGLRPSIDAIEEVRVLSNNYSAEFGRTAGAIVNIITKSGTNDFHGSAFEYFRNDVFDARNFFSAVNPEYRQNEFGGSLGGRIIRNRTFFFGDIEENRMVQASTSTYTVPTLYEEQHPGDFSDIGGAVVPASKINPIALALFNLQPAPNKPGAVANYVSNPKKTQYATTMDAKVDHHFNDTNVLFVRYGMSPVSTVVPGGYPIVNVNGTAVDPSPDWANGPSKTTSQGAQVNYVHVFRPELLLELKAGFMRINIQSFPLNFGTNMSQKFGIINSNLDWASSGLAMMGITGYGGIGAGMYTPILDIGNSFQYSGGVTYVKGSHNIRMGAALIRRQLDDFGQNYSPQGGFVFYPIPPYNNAMANFLAGSALFAERGNTLFSPGFRNWEPSVFMQDDWRATRWLTLNLGVRYEVFTPITEVHNAYSNFDMSSLQVVMAGHGTSSTLGVNTDYKNISPRVGFAATLGHGMVLRGGYGLSYYPADIQGVIQNANPPYSFVCLPCYGTQFPVLPLPTLGSLTNPSGSVTVKPSNFRPSYLHQFNLFFQKEIAGNVLSLGGVGELGRDLLYQKDLDRPLPPGAGNPTPALVYATQLPKVSGITLNDNEAISNYYAMQASFVRRYSKGLTVNANYTWAHGLSNSPNGSGYTSGTGIVSNNPMYDYGNSDIDVRQRVAFSATYEIPVAKASRGLAARTIQGWQVNGIAYWQTGLPFTVTNPAAAINLPGVTSDRPNQVADWKLSNPTISQWINTAAFVTQTKGTAGNEARNQLYGPNQRGVNLSLLKNFAFRESWRLQFRAECFNITNTANFDLPGNSMATSSLGLISATSLNATPRQIQFALKLLF